MRSVRGGEERAHLDTTDTVTVDDGELNVTFVTPGGVPGVLDKPVILSTFRAVAYSEDGVIKLGAAFA